MTHLKILQSSSLETRVPPKVVDLIYKEDKAGNLDGSSSFKGSIYVNYVKKILKEYLEAKYPDFSILCEEYALSFEDPLVEEICVLNWGDGAFITEAKAAAATGILYNKFSLTDIESFDELPYFGFNELYGYYGNATSGSFYNCAKLKTIDLKKITILGRGVFSGCLSLETVKNFSITRLSSGDEFRNCASLKNIDIGDLTYIGNYSFSGCSSLDIEINLPNLTNLELGAFIGSGIKHVTNLGSIQNLTGAPQHYGGGVFANCENLETVVVPATVTRVGEYVFMNCRKLKYIVFQSTTPPVLEDEYSLQAVHRIADGTIIYVPDDSVNDYKTADYWDMLASIIKPLSEFEA